MKNMYNTNSKHNKAGIAILILGKTDFKTKIITRDKYIIMKKSKSIRKI